MKNRALRLKTFNAGGATGYSDTTTVLLATVLPLQCYRYSAKATVLPLQCYHDSAPSYSASTATVLLLQCSQLEC